MLHLPQHLMKKLETIGAKNPEKKLMTLIMLQKWLILKHILKNKLTNYLALHRTCYKNSKI